MSRIDDLMEYRKTMVEILEADQRAGKDIRFASLSVYLIEISDTLAYMYDKMCEEKK